MTEKRLTEAKRLLLDVKGLAEGLFYSSCQSHVGTLAMKPRLSEVAPNYGQTSQTLWEEPF